MKIRHSLFAGAAIAAMSLPVLAHAGEVAGTVSDTSNTIALRSAQVRIVELDRVTATSRDGSFLFADVPAGAGDEGRLSFQSHGCSALLF